MNFSSNQPWQTCCSLYDAPQPVINMHEFSRFGHTSDFAQAIITGEYDDYVAGLIAVPIIFAIIFVLWQFAIIVMKCCGCGFLSGKNLVVDSHGERQTEVNIISLFFLLSCIGLLTSLSLYITEGLDGMGKSVAIFTSLITNLNNITTVNANYMQNISTQFEYAQSVYHNNSQSSSQEKSVANMLGSLCPDRLDIQTKSIIFNMLMGNFSEALSGGGGLDAIQNAEALFEQISEVIDEAEGSVSDILEIFNVAATAYYTPLFVMTILLILSCLTTRFFRSIPIWDCFISYFILPIFQLFITCSWVLSLVLLIFAMANSDLCYGGDQNSPQGAILSFFERQDDSQDFTEQKSQLAYSTAMYYIGCNVTFPFDVIGTLANFTSSTAKPGQVLIDTISDQLSDSQRYLQEEGQAANIFVKNSNTLVQGSCVTQEVYQDLQTIVSVLKLLTKLMTDLVKYVSCDFVVPVYDQLVNTALCTYSPVSLVWASSSLIVTSACGLMMVTLRSALYPTE